MLIIGGSRRPPDLTGRNHRVIPAIETRGRVRILKSDFILRWRRGPSSHPEYLREALPWMTQLNPSFVLTVLLGRPGVPYVPHRLRDVWRCTILRVM